MNLLAWFLLLQAAIVAASLLGYGIFTARPDLLMQVDPQAKFFAWAFHGFAVGNMLFGGLAVVTEAFWSDRQKAVWAFAAVYLVSFASEFMGTSYDPIRAYSCRNGIKWFDRVPLLIPVAGSRWLACGYSPASAPAGPAPCCGTSLLVAGPLAQSGDEQSDELLGLG
jgi:hypothetical protein